MIGNFKNTSLISTPEAIEAFLIVSLTACLADNVNARVQNARGKYTRVKIGKNAPVNSQAYLGEMAQLAQEKKKK